MGKITEEELQKIQVIRKETSEIIYSLGELEYQRTGIDLTISEIKEKVKALRVREAQTLSDLKEKYGNVSINIETGEF